MDRSSGNELNRNAKHVLNMPTDEVQQLILSVMNISSYGILQWKVPLDKLLLSREAFEIIGADPENFNGTMQHMVDTFVHPSFKIKFEQAMKNDILEGKTLTRDYRMNNPQKEDCWIRCHSKVILNSDNEVEEILSIITDVTEDYEKYGQAMKELDFIESLFETMPNPVFYKDRSGIYRYCNRAFMDYLGLKKDQIIGKSVYDISEPALARIYADADEELFTLMDRQEYEAKVRRPDGLHDVIFNKALHLNEQKKPIGLVGVIQDITEKKMHEKHLEMLHKVKEAFLDINHAIIKLESEEELMNIIMQKLMGIVEQSDQACILKVDENNDLSIVASSGYNEKEASSFKVSLKDSIIGNVLAKTTDKVVVIEDVQKLSRNAIVKVVATDSGNEIRSSLIIPVFIDDMLKWIISMDSSREHVFNDTSKRVAAFVSEEIPLLYRIFELHRKNLYLSRFDPLTGMMTRHYMDAVFEDWMAVSSRHNLCFCIAVFDLDGMKEINDRYGHFQGDVFIKTFAEHILSSFRESDKFFRIGGDEFLGLFFNSTRQEMQQCIERIRNEFEERMSEAGDQSVKYSFSFGMADFPLESDDKTTLIRLADRRMYKDKQVHKE